MRKRASIWLRNACIGLILIGAVLMTGEWIYKKLSGEESRETMRISRYYLTHENGLSLEEELIEYVEDEEKIERILEEFKRFRGFKRAVWEFPPKCETYLSVWYKERAYGVCKGKEEWYVVFEGGGVRSPMNFFKVSEDEAKEIIKKIEKEVKNGSHSLRTSQPREL